MIDTMGGRVDPQRHRAPARRCRLDALPGPSVVLRIRQRAIACGRARVQEAEASEPVLRDAYRACFFRIERMHETGDVFAPMALGIRAFRCGEHVVAHARGELAAAQVHGHLPRTGEFVGRFLAVGLQRRYRRPASAAIGLAHIAQHGGGVGGGDQRGRAGQQKAEQQAVAT